MMGETANPGDTCLWTSGLLPLADFGFVAFTSAQVDGSPLGVLHPTARTMRKSLTTPVKGSPGPLQNGTDFVDAWYHR
jgi:hypothetical protein